MDPIFNTWAETHPPRRRDRKRSLARARFLLMGSMSLNTRPRNVYAPLAGPSQLRVPKYHSLVAPNKT